MKHLMCQALNTLNIDRTRFLPSVLEFSGRNNIRVREKDIGIIMVNVQATVGTQEREGAVHGIINDTHSVRNKYPTSAQIKLAD